MPVYRPCSYPPANLALRLAATLFALLALALSLAALPRAVGADTPQSVAIIGDSMAKGYCRGLRRHLKGVEGYALNCWSHPSSGLTRNDFLDWDAKLAGYLSETRIDIAVVAFGANDAQRLVLADRILDFDEAAWAEEYGDRVERIIDQLSVHGAQIVWVGMPISRSARYSRKMARLNEIYAARTAARGVPYLSIWEATQDDSGRYSAALPDATGRTRVMRDKDGIHFTGAGEALISCLVLARFPGVGDPGTLSRSC
ncbi:MAG: DUF459 domain-containing protein [Pseudomonadota bacterium]